jgi:hypothetical protein
VAVVFWVRWTGAFQLYRFTWFSVYVRTRNKVVELRRQQTFVPRLTLVVGEVIAVGIFLTPAGMAKSPPTLLLVVWTGEG